MPHDDVIDKVNIYRSENKSGDNLESVSSDSANESPDDGAATTPNAADARKRASTARVGIASPDDNKVPKSVEESGDSEYSAPKFMSLVCIMQMVKLMDAVGILFPHTLPGGTKPITSKREFLDQFASAKMSAHIDCPNCKAFVSYRWYANDVKELKTHLSASVEGDKKVLFDFFCETLHAVSRSLIRTGHWLLQPRPLEAQAARCQAWPRRCEISAFTAATLLPG
jgi:hypothetical protein